jgi:hypothetical protein
MTKLVLPIEGRAATMTRSEGWNPDVISSGRHAGDEPAGLGELFDELIAGIDELADPHKPGAHPVVGNLEDRSLRLVEEIVGVLLGIVRAREHLGGRLDQASKC